MIDAQNNRDESWSFLHRLMTTLGRDGMSSDETEVEDQHGYRRPYKKCRVKRRAWRSKQLEPYMKMVDRECNRKNVYGNDRPGNRPHVRVRPARKVSQRRNIPPYLPRNFYDDDWYDGLTAMQKRELAAVPPVRLMVFEEEEEEE